MNVHHSESVLLTETDSTDDHLLLDIQTLFANCRQVFRDDTGRDFKLTENKSYPASFLNFLGLGHTQRSQSRRLEYAPVVLKIKVDKLYRVTQNLCIRQWNTQEKHRRCADPEDWDNGLVAMQLRSTTKETSTDYCTQSVKTTRR